MIGAKHAWRSWRGACRGGGDPATQLPSEEALGTVALVINTFGRPGLGFTIVSVRNVALCALNDGVHQAETKIGGAIQAPMFGILKDIPALWRAKDWVTSPNHIAELVI